MRVINLFTDDGGSARMQNLRHNPYVGSLDHSRNSFSTGRNAQSNTSLLRLLPRSANLNPILGTFLHSPSNVASVGSGNPAGINLRTTAAAAATKRSNSGSSSQGLKDILWDDDKTPQLSQLQLAREQKQLAHHMSPAVLKTLPISKYTKIWENCVDTPNEADAPQCAICLDGFIDGDELRNLPCGHLFHRKCIDTWLLGYLSNENTNTCSCPQCRQNALTLCPPSSSCVADATSETSVGSEEDSNSPTSVVPVTAFLLLGQFLSESGLVSGESVQSEVVPQQQEAAEKQAMTEEQKRPDNIALVSLVSLVLGDVDAEEDVDGVDSQSSSSVVAAPHLGSDSDEDDYSDCGVPLR